MQSINIQDYDYFFKLLTLGDSGVGKSSFLYRYTDGVFTPNYVSTVGIDFRTKLLNYHFQGRSHRILIQLWDTAGQERFRSLTTSFYRGAMGFLLFFDITNERSFLEVRNWLSLIKTHAFREDLDIILCGHKADLVNKRQISFAQAKKVADEEGLIYIETSAKNGQNITQAIENLVELVLQRMFKAIGEDFDLRLLYPKQEQEYKSRYDNCLC